MRNWIWLPLAALCASVAAEEDPFGDAFDSGFSDVETSAPASNSNVYIANRLIHRGQWATAHDAPEPGATDHRSLASLVTAWNPRVEWRPNDRLSALLDAELSHDWVFDLKSGADWKTPYRDQRETQFDLVEARLAYTTPDWALTSGRQVLTWGFNDVLSILEPVNPQQLSQPGFYDAKDARLSRWLTERDGTSAAGHSRAWSRTKTARLNSRFLAATTTRYRLPPMTKPRTRAGRTRTLTPAVFV